MTYPFQSQSTPDLTNSLLIPVGMYMYSITCTLILTISPITILNLPTNLFCLLDTALVLTSDNFLLNFPPSIPLATPWCHFCRVFTYLPSLLIENDGCDHQNILIKFPCVCECLSYGDLFNFW
jgi:hypothetical protein